MKAEGLLFEGRVNPRALRERWGVHAPSGEVCPEVCLAGQRPLPSSIFYHGGRIFRTRAAKDLRPHQTPDWYGSSL